MVKVGHRIRALTSPMYCRSHARFVYIYVMLNHHIMENIHMFYMKIYKNNYTTPVFTYAIFNIHNIHFFLRNILIMKIVFS